MKTFGKVFARIDRMAGLYVETDDRRQRCNVQGWDEVVAPELSAEVVDAEDQTVWHGILFTRNYIEKIFPRVKDDGQPIPFARRIGRLGKPKTVGVIRLASGDGEKFELQQCNGGEEVKAKLAEFSYVPKLQIIIQIKTSYLMASLFDEGWDVLKKARF